MLDIGQRKPLVSPSSGDGEGLFSDTPQSAHHLIPSEPPRAACPVNPKPRNMPEYRAACAVALGAPVKEYPACQVMPGMQVYHNGRFLEVTQTLREPHHFPVHVELWLEGHGIVSARVADLEAPLYCLA